MAEAILTTNGALRVNRRAERFASDDHRVLARFFEFGGEERSRSVIERVLALPEGEVDRLIADVLKSFSSRHRRIELIFERHFSHVSRYVSDPHGLSHNRRMLIGAYFTMEYAIESAALFNPSIVPHPNQRDVPEGAMRFLMSLRATGEGHISSIVFRRGIIHADGEITFDPPPRYAFTAKPVQDKLYEKRLFLRKLHEMGDWDELATAMCEPLPDWFTRDQLEEAIAQFVTPEGREKQVAATVEDMRWLAMANYTLRFPADSYPMETVIFPATDVESKGMEDLRLVSFTDDDGTRTYYGTYTAYDGKRILPMLLETQDFKTFHVATLNGDYATNKGMALFPRKINGSYMAIGRHDGEKLYLMIANEPHFWNESHLLIEPIEPWELTQIGNCGSPIETDAGWILLTHGVGPMRRYCIGAMLLDKDDPMKVLGRLREPLIMPTEEEREGYVPNVVYSCGAMLHGDTLIIPYAMSDVATRIATIPVRALVNELIANGA